MTPVLQKLGMLFLTFVKCVTAARYWRTGGKDDKLMVENESSRICMTLIIHKESYGWYTLDSSFWMTELILIPID